MATNLTAHEELGLTHSIHPRTLVEQIAGGMQVFDLDAIVNDLELELDDAVSDVRDDITVLWGEDTMLFDDGAAPLSTEETSDIRENIMGIDLNKIFGAHVQLATAHVN